MRIGKQGSDLDGELCCSPLDLVPAGFFHAARGDLDLLIYPAIKKLPTFYLKMDALSQKEKLATFTCVLFI